MVDAPPPITKAHAQRLAELGITSIRRDTPRLEKIISAVLDSNLLFAQSSVIDERENVQHIRDEVRMGRSPRFEFSNDLLDQLIGRLREFYAFGKSEELRARGHGSFAGSQKFYMSIISNLSDEGIRHVYDAVTDPESMTNIEIRKFVLLTIARSRNTPIELLIKIHDTEPSAKWLERYPPDVRAETSTVLKRAADMTIRTLEACAETTNTLLDLCKLEKEGLERAFFFIGTDGMREVDKQSNAIEHRNKNTQEQYGIRHLRIGEEALDKALDLLARLHSAAGSEELRSEVVEFVQKLMFTMDPESLGRVYRKAASPGFEVTFTFRIELLSALASSVHTPLPALEEIDEASMSIGWISDLYARAKERGEDLRELEFYTEPLSSHANESLHDVTSRQEGAALPISRRYAHKLKESKGVHR